MQDLAVCRTYNKKCPLVYYCTCHLWFNFQLFDFIFLTTSTATNLITQKYQITLDCCCQWVSEFCYLTILEEQTWVFVADKVPIITLCDPALPTLKAKLLVMIACTAHCLYKFYSGILIIYFLLSYLFVCTSCIMHTICRQIHKLEL